MKRLNRELIDKGSGLFKDVGVGNLEAMPERIVQFGEGNFLRAFVDSMVDGMNRQGLFMGKVVVVQPIPHGLVDVLNEQDGLYTLLLRGIDKGRITEEKRIITSVSRGINPYEDWKGLLSCAAQPEMRFMVSNTTEAGIAYVEEGMPTDSCPTSFPAKVTAFLYERFKAFSGCPDRGMIILPCELIDRNGDSLKEIVLRYADEWDLGGEFTRWIKAHNHFLNTLVDRIVTGYPKDEIDELNRELGYEDRLLDTGEPFHLWVIEGDERLSKELPLTEAGFNVVWTEDLTPYRTRKVRILNGAHTMTALMAYLYGLDTVRQCIEDDTVLSYMKKGLYDEILPILDFPKDEKQEFADAVLERFNNPFIEHNLLSISLNSVSKWKVRVLPSLIESVDLRDSLPKVLTFSLASLLAFYRGTEIMGGALIGERMGEQYTIQDDGDVLEFFRSLWDEYESSGNLGLLCTRALGKKGFWDMDLNRLPGMTEKVREYLGQILNTGMANAVRELIGK
ncbi:MAG TPA: tagaturonate reductase [Clostridia bacterium]|nr:tagaturonate reductase [Clostridia bacterium]